MAMECRQNFQNYVKTNPMYKDSNRPWTIIERLSERIIDELLKEVATEAKLDIMINDIYNMELQRE
ncbi:hypothetical protein L9F63_007970 [Diploptera punctata]|uniref:Uncharacterized protein n=1 Tax=Diploptera punctata TaxID=6984 RepID=A0AAD7Z6X4_DIPPU|nr:hypothetical protein L9F63_007970 [Diploptera punctata]